MTIWFDKGSKSLSISFIPKHIKLGIVKYNNNARKHIDSCYDFNLIFLGLHISYTNWEYNKIVNVIINDANKYANSDEAENIGYFQKKLHKIVSSYENNNEFSIKMPIAFAFQPVDDTHYKYYISGPKKYFEKNNLKTLLPAEYMPSYCDEIVEAQRQGKFPNYTTGVTKIISL